MAWRATAAIIMQTKSISSCNLPRRLQMLRLLCLLLLMGRVSHSQADSGSGMDTISNSETNHNYTTTSQPSLTTSQTPALLQPSFSTPALLRASISTSQTFTFAPSEPSMTESELPTSSSLQAAPSPSLTTEEEMLATPSFFLSQSANLLSSASMDNITLFTPSVPIATPTPPSTVVSMAPDPYTMVFSMDLSTTIPMAPPSLSPSAVVFMDLSTTIPMASPSLSPSAVVFMDLSTTIPMASPSLSPSAVVFMDLSTTIPMASPSLSPSAVVFMDLSTTIPMAAPSLSPSAVVFMDLSTITVPTISPSPSTMAASPSPSPYTMVLSMDLSGMPSSPSPSMAPSMLTPSSPSMLTPSSPSMLMPSSPSMLTPSSPSMLTPSSPSILTPSSPSPSISTTAPTMSSSPFNSSTLPTPSSLTLPLTTSLPPATTTDLWARIVASLTFPGAIGTFVAGAVVLILLIVVFCLCCCCICKCVRKRRSKKRPNFSERGFSFENRGAMDMYGSQNGVMTKTYRNYGPHGSSLEIEHPHHYDDTTHFRETSIDKELEIVLTAGDRSQALPSQASLANTDIFQKNTLPELSPMAYSLTATYPSFQHDHSQLMLNTLPDPTTSLRQPTMFGLSLQNEESKSAQGSRISISGSKPSIHGSRPSIYGSRASSLHGSRHMVYNSRTSRESLMPTSQQGREHVIEDEVDTLSLGNRIPSPSLLPLPPLSSDPMEVPTRESPLSRPLSMSFSHQLGHGKKDFASLTCIPNHNADSLPASPEHETTFKMEEGQYSKTTSPQRRPAGTRRDLTTLTSLTGPAASAETKNLQQNTIPEEEEGSETPKVKKSKDSPGVKKARSKTMSRLEKLTSLDYIRQSFRLKKKKVSFQNTKTPETTPKASKKGTKKTASSNSTVISNQMANRSDNSPTTGTVPEAGSQRRASIQSTEPFSPTADPFYRAQPHAYSGDHSMAMVGLGYAQLSQPNYYVPHMSYHQQQPQYPYPQLSQQYYPQLSQSYTYQSYHHPMPINDSFNRGFPRDGGHHRDHAGTRRCDVVTPDFSDITTPEHERYRERNIDTPDSTAKADLDYNYELRPQSPGSYGRPTSPEGYKEREQSPDKFTETSTTSDQYRGGSPDLFMQYGAHQTGVHPEYRNSAAISNRNHFAAETSYPVGSPQRYGLGYSPRHQGQGQAQSQQGARRNSLDHYKERRSSLDHYIRSKGEGMEHGGNFPLDARGFIPEDPSYMNSISVDEPPQHYAINHRQKSSNHNHGRMEQRYSGYSESSTSEGRFSGSSSVPKARVSWKDEVTEYPSNKDVDY